MSDDEKKVVEHMRSIGDTEMLEMMLGTAMQRRAGGLTEGAPVEGLRVMEEAIGRCVTNLKRVPQLIQDLADAREQLAIERASVARLKKVVALGADMLPGNPDNYPESIRPFVNAVHREANS